MPAKKNVARLANDAASAIIREITEKHFVKPPEGSFTVREFISANEYAIGLGRARNKLDKLVAGGVLKALRVGKDKYYWRAK